MVPDGVNDWRERVPRRFEGEEVNGKCVLGTDGLADAVSENRAFAGVGSVAVTLTALSLSHLAHGIEIVTGCQSWEGWAMAVGIDLGFVALELSQLAVYDKVRRQASRFARPAILGTLAGSAGMNAFAFSAQAINSYMMAAGITLGVAIPALVYALTRVGAALVTDCHSRGGPDHARAHDRSAPAV